MGDALVRVTPYIYHLAIVKFIMNRYIAAERSWIMIYHAAQRPPKPNIQKSISSKSIYKPLHKPDSRKVNWAEAYIAFNLK